MRYNIFEANKAEMSVSDLLGSILRFTELHSKVVSKSPQSSVVVDVFCDFSAVVFVIYVSCGFVLNVNKQLE